jgi:hypothetical protein
VIAAVVVVVYEAGDGHLQITRHFIRDLVYLVLDGSMVPLWLPVDLRMIRHRQDVPGPYQAQVMPRRLRSRAGQGPQAASANYDSPNHYG